MDFGQGFAVRRALGAGSDGLPAVRRADRDPHGASPRRARAAAARSRRSPGAWRARRRGAARRWALAWLGLAAWQAGERPRQRPARLAARRRASRTRRRRRARHRPDRAARAQRAGARARGTGERRQRAARWLHRIDPTMSETLAPAAAAQRLADGEAAPVLRADEAARRPADRLLRADRHAAGDAGLPDWRLALAAIAGIWLVAAAAAAFNCLVEQRIDSRMARTVVARRPPPAS